MQTELINVVTKDGVNLQGLVFTPKSSPSARPPVGGLRSGQTPTTVGVWIHGLGSNFYGGYTRLVTLATHFTEKGMAFAAINTRGHDSVSRAIKQDKRKKRGYRSIMTGSAYEKFRDSALDLDAMVEELGRKFSKIVLMGHSTGCNKAVYFLSRKSNQKKVYGVALVAPVSDIPNIKNELKENFEKVLTIARRMVKQGKDQELLPYNLYPYVNTAQRFVSLATYESVEQMFSTKEFQGPLRLFSKIKVPTLIVFGDQDEFVDVPLDEFLSIFAHNTKNRAFSGTIIKGADHSFSGKEEELARALVSWIKSV